MTDEEYIWTVYDLEERMECEAFYAPCLLREVNIMGVLGLVFKKVPELKGKNFVVNDEDTERLYMMWNGVDGYYDEYTHTGGMEMRE